MAKRVVAKKKPSPKQPEIKKTAPEPPIAAPDPETVHLTTKSRRIVLPAANSLVPNLMQPAMQWTYVVRSRQRWSATPSSIEDQAKAARDFLGNCGVDDEALKAIALSELVEVSVNWSGNEAQGWAPRILPWEYVIAGATRSLRKELPLTVTRHLNRFKDRAMPVESPIERVLFVVSEPGKLRHKYEFDSERRLVKAAFDGKKWAQLDSPTEAELRSKISSFKPDLVHLAGFDSHQAIDELPDDELSEGKSSNEVRDGCVLSGPTGPKSVNAEELAGILAADGHRPKLVSLNIRNSAARIAPLVVGAGASAAIGFQDIFNDELAEMFFSVLYTRLGRSGDKLHKAFRLAWERVRTEPAHSQGTGIALWSAVSAFPAAPEQQAPQIDAEAERREAQPQPKVYVDAATVKADELEKWISVKLEPPEELNYSMLHNQCSLFKKFVVHAPHESIRNVQVHVSLSAGSESAVYDRTLNIDSPSHDLNIDVHVPLTSSITRSVHESVQTSLFAEVKWGDHVVYRDTKPVRLTPVDQWRDTDTDRKWLPSFIFPRDAAVTHLVDIAQRYVQVVRDDPGAGFDGYQGFEPGRQDSTVEVDLQVQAIWAAIIHEMRLGYINPPPGYSSKLDSQRLRTPTMIARDHSGTCIDLALFLAACLELIDVYPVIFMLNGHAFPGYWRDESYHADFTRAHPGGIENIVRADHFKSEIAGAQTVPWYLGKSTYEEIVQLVNDGKLVPIETVRLTEHTGFYEAVEAGKEALSEKSEFAGMVDVALAREKQVTPLPILGEQS
jgi:hypothetical protein